MAWDSMSMALSLSIRSYVGYCRFLEGRIVDCVKSAHAIYPQGPPRLSYYTRDVVGGEDVPSTVMFKSHGDIGKQLRV